MVANNDGEPLGSVEQFPLQPRPRVVSEELNMISTSLRQVCPPGSKIGFDFDGVLRVHIDVRNLEDVTKVEAILPTLGASMFCEIHRGLTPRHSFFHRITAHVDR
jgi:hypothetical protein